MHSKWEKTVIISKNFQDVNSVFDFYEGIIGDVRWENNTDLLISVCYFFDEPKGFQNKDIIIRFKKCFSAKFDYTKMIFSVKEYSIVTPHPEIESISVKKSDSCINVTITTNFADMIQICCDDIWIESKDC